MSYLINLLVLIVAATSLLTLVGLLEGHILSHEDDGGPNHAEIRTPEQWFLEYNCSASLDQASCSSSDQPEVTRLHENCARSSRASSFADYLRDERCRHRDPSSWMFEYSNELKPNFKLLVRDLSVDQRLANNIYMITQTRAFKGNMNWFKFKSNSNSQDSANKKLVAGPQVDDELCRKHLGQMIDQVDDLRSRLGVARKVGNVTGFSITGQDIYLARVLDSFARYESGYLSGRFYTLGSYEQCVTSGLKFDDGPSSSTVGTRFCWALFNTDRHLAQDLKTKQERAHNVGDNVFRAGICIPQTCHSKSFDDQEMKDNLDRLVRGQFRFPSSMYLDESLEVGSMFCTVDRDSEMAKIPLSGRLLLAILTIWLIYLIIILWVRGDPTGIARARDSTNVSDGSRSDKVNVDLLNVCRVILTLQLILIHSCALTAAFGSNYVFSVASPELDPVFTFILFNVAEVIDSFFIISGMLLTYSFMCKLDKIDASEYSCKRLGKEWLRFTLGRYLKLMPLLSLVVWFKKSLFARLPPGGPMWDDGLNVDAGIGYCVQEQSWWTLLVPWFGQLTLAKACQPVAWTVSADLVFAIILPMVVYLLLMRAQIFLPAIVVLILSSVHSAYKMSAESDKQLTWELREIKAHGTTILSTSMTYLYTNPWHRLAYCLVGLVAGFFVYLYQAVPEMRWPKWFTGAATNLSILSLILHFTTKYFGFLIRDLLNPYHILILPHLSSSIRLMFAVAIAVILIRIVTDWSGYLMSNLGSMGTWLALSRLSYAINLVHWDILTYDFNTGSSDMLFGWRSIITTFFKVYSLSLLVSVMLYNLIQKPLKKLVKTKVLYEK